MKVPQFQPWVGQEEYAAIRECFDLNWITEGPQSTKFAQELLELIGAKYGVFAPNGTLAIYLGLRAIGVGPGDEVIVPSINFIGIPNAILSAGAKPILYYVECSVEKMRERVVTRSKLPPEDSFEISGEMFDSYLKYWQPPEEDEEFILAK